MADMTQEIFGPVLHVLRWSGEPEAVIDAIRNMHAQIRAEVNRQERLHPDRSNNVKLGRGGIREIEFFAQTQQLIAGGLHTFKPLRQVLEQRPVGEGAAGDLDDVEAHVADDIDRFLVEGRAHREQAAAADDREQFAELVPCCAALEKEAPGRRERQNHRKQGGRRQAKATEEKGGNLTPCNAKTTKPDKQTGAVKFTC